MLVYCIRRINKEDIVILDSLNYIKGKCSPFVFYN
jgi:tRNA uridine 5-carbamoylmethylation protein Kti12